MNSAELLDERQLSVYKNTPENHWLSKKNNLLKFYEWNTFFRRNINRYAELYFGLNLYPYQHLELYEMNTKSLNVIIGSRAVAKSYVVAVFACCKASLYPNSKIVIASATKSQSKLIVTEKIKSELMSKSPNLCREILTIKDNQNDIIVTFRNGSTIKVVPASDNARGNRSSCMIYEEFRMIDKFIIDSVLSPFQIVRPVPYLKYAEYSMLAEEPTDIYISSAWYSSHWMGGLIKSTTKGIMNGKDYCILGFDYSLTLKHNIKTKNLIWKDYKKFDPMTFAIEYQNRMISENLNAYYSFDIISPNQVLKRAFYPKKEFSSARSKNKHDIPKQEGEVRVVSCDIAMMTKEGNDNSAFTCLRLLPETIQKNNGENRQSYRIQVPYIEAFQGGETSKQAIRIMQLYEDFEADYIVLDARNAGISVYDCLAKYLYDDERGCEYKPLKCMNNDDIAKRIVNSNARPAIYCVTASAKFNSEMAVNLRSLLMERKIDLLINHNDGIEEIQKYIPEYSKMAEAEDQVFFEKPFLETMCLINEMINLEYEKSELTGLIRITESAGMMKDRYISLGMGCLFTSELERDMLSFNDEIDISAIPSCVSAVEL